MSFSYHWLFHNRRYDKYFGPADNNENIAIKDSNGTLVFNKPTAKRDTGFYQCFASNTGGVAASRKIYLRKTCKKNIPIGDLLIINYITYIYF